MAVEEEISRFVPGTFRKKRKGMIGWLWIMLKFCSSLEFIFPKPRGLVCLCNSYFGELKTDLVCFLSCIFGGIMGTQKPVKEQPWLGWQIASYT